jgi:hypothetical protein
VGKRGKREIVVDWRGKKRMPNNGDQIANKPQNNQHLQTLAAQYNPKSDNKPSPITQDLKRTQAGYTKIGKESVFIFSAPQMDVREAHRLRVLFRQRSGAKRRWVAMGWRRRQEKRRLVDAPQQQTCAWRRSLLKRNAFLLALA